MRKRTPQDISILRAECKVYINALIQANFHKTKAAGILGVDRRTLYSKLNKFKSQKVYKTIEIADKT